MVYSYRAAMGKILPVLVLVATLMFVDGRDVQQNNSRIRRGFNAGGFGGHDGGGYGRGSDEQDASVSREGIGGCSEEGRGYGGSRELSFSRDRDGRGSNENRRGGRSFSKASATASASASTFNQNQKAAV